MRKKVITSRNGQIDFWRFVGIVMIVIGHSNKLLENPPLEDVFAIWVDFFFIVTGFFTAAAVNKAKSPCDINTLGTETVTYTLKKIKSFYIYFIFAAVTALISKVILHGFDEVILSWKLFGSVNDFLLTYASGSPSMMLTVGEWYLSAMVLAVAIIYPIARKYPNLFQNVIAPLSAIFLFGTMLHNEGALTDPGTWYGITTKGTIRAIAGVCLGFAANKLAANIKESRIFEKNIGIAFITLVDIFAIPFAIVLMVMGIKAKYSSAIIFFLFAGVVSSLSGKSKFTKLFSNKLCLFLGKLSLPVFLCQGAIIYLIKAFQNANNDFNSYCNSAEGMPIMLAILVIGTIGLALICLLVCDPLTKTIDKIIEKLKS